MDAIIELVKSIVKTEFIDLPDEAVYAAKMDILDTIGVTIAGSGVAGGRELMGLIGDWGGKEESSVIMYDMKVPSPHAALVNGTMAHALDYDDAHEGVILHAGVTVIPAALAIAERTGNVDGRKFLSAVVSGIDVICRLGEASNISPSELGFMYTSLYGIFGAAVACGKLLGFDEERMLNAVGIAYSQAAGNFQCIADGALTKRMQAGFAAMGGVNSALIASMGLTGARNSLEGEKGLFQVYLRGNYDPAKLTANLGKHFGVVDLSFKPYPCCRNCHPFIDATLELANENDIPVDNVEEVRATCSEVARLLCEPLEAKQRPRTFVDAQFSIPWVIATALVKRKVSLRDFTPEAILDESVIRISSNVKTFVDPRMEARTTTPAIIEIKMKGSGKIFSKRVDIAKGNPAEPMSWQELCEKFKDCAGCGVRDIPKENVNKLLDIFSGFEDVEDISNVIRLIS
ncbi:MAG: MmgE/PrpD family protein [Deltaproteobacteria bacterium]|nr:MmgE/PrpD family protein [Deltaproteobacteria bacterium]